MKQFKKNISLLKYTLIVVINCMVSNLHAVPLDKNKKVSPFEMVQLYAKKTDQDVNNINVKNYAIGFSKPIYETYVSYGFEFNIGANKRLVSYDLGLLLKLTSPPLSYEEMSAVLTLTGIGGFSAMPLLNVENAMFSFDKRIGGHIALSIGTEIFPVKWLGLGIEFQNRYYWTDSNSNAEKKYASTKPFNPNYDNLLVISFRTTW
jgi:hypothetical protein